MWNLYSMHVKTLFSDKTQLALYNSFVYPYLNYCIPVWGNTYESILDPLVKLQKRVIRIIAGVKSRISSDPLFRKFKVLKVNQIYQYFVHIFVWSIDIMLYLQYFIFFLKEMKAFMNITLEINIYLECLSFVWTSEKEW